MSSCRATNAKGYGRFGRGEMAHRAALRLVGVQVPDGMEVDHTCRNRACVNPAHLDVVTHAENIARKPPPPPTCPAGHPMDRSAHRECRDCASARASARYRKSNPNIVRRGRRWLTSEERSKIRTLVAAGRSHSEIAPIFGISIATVSRVRNSNA